MENKIFEITATYYGGLVITVEMSAKSEQHARTNFTRDSFAVSTLVIINLEIVEITR